MINDPTHGRLRISPDGMVVADELGENDPNGDYFLYVRKRRVGYTTKTMNPEIASWPKLGVITE